MKEGKLNFYTSLGFVFFTEGLAISMVYPLAPLLLSGRDIRDIQQSDSYPGDLPVLKAHLCLKVGFFLVAFHLAQAIGMLFWYSRCSLLQKVFPSECFQLKVLSLCHAFWLKPGPSRDCLRSFLSINSAIASACIFLSAHSSCSKASAVRLWEL